jgi:hypothetical protein
MATLVLSLVFMIVVVGTLAGWAARTDRRGAIVEAREERWMR